MMGKKALEAAQVRQHAARLPCTPLYCHCRRPVMAVWSCRHSEVALFDAALLRSCA